MNISSGTAILYKNKILLCHPTNLPWKNSFSIPKGGVDDGETLIDAAIRETWEEVGIKITKNQISNTEDPIEILYINKAGKLFKKCYVFIVKIKELSELGLESEILNKGTLQLTEVDWAGFKTKEESNDIIFYRFKPILNLI